MRLLRDFTRLYYVVGNIYLYKKWPAKGGIRDATHIIFVGYSLPIADFEFRYMLQKNVTSSAKIDVILTPNSNPDLVANNLKDLLPSKRYLDAFPKNKVSFYYEGFGPYFSLSK